MGILIAKTGPDFMSGVNSNVRADYEGRVRLASNNLFPDPGLRTWEEKTGQLRYLTLGEAPKPTHWAPYMRDKNNVKSSSRQVLAPIDLEQTVYDQEDELVHGPSPTDELRTISIAAPLAPEAKAYAVSDTVGLPEGFYCIAWGYSPDDDWQKPNAVITNPGPRSEVFYLAQGQGFLVAAPTEFSSKIKALVLWITEPRLIKDGTGEINPVMSAQGALRAPMYAIQKWRTRGIDDFLRVVGPFNKKIEEEMPLPEKRNLTFVGDRRDMPKVKVSRDGGHHKHDEAIHVQVGYAFQTESGIGEVKMDGGWHNVPAGRQVIKFEPADFEMRRDNEETNRERKRERDQDGKSNDANETNKDNEDDTTDSRGRTKRKEQTERIRGWRPIVRFKATNDPDDPDDEHGVTEYYMIVDKGGKNAFREKGEAAVVLESEPGKWPAHNRTELARVTVMEKDESGVKDPTEAPEAPSGDLILDLNTSGLTPGKHWVKSTLFVVSGDDEEESDPSPETEVDVAMGEGIRVKRPRWHNLADNDAATEFDLEDFDLPLGWEFFKPFPTNVKAYNAKRGGMTIEDNSNSSATYSYMRTSVATLRNDTNHYTLRFNVDSSRHVNGMLRAILEEYDMVDGVPQLVGSRIIKTWASPVNDKNFEFLLSLNQNDPNNKHKIRLNANTKHIRLRFEGVGNTDHGVRNFDFEFTKYGVFQGWARPRKSKRLDAKRAETPEPKDTTYPHGGYCVVVEDPTEGNPVDPLYTVVRRLNFEDNSDFTSNWTLTSTGSTTGGRGQDYAIRNDWGWRAAKTLQGALGSYYIQHVLASGMTNIALSTLFFVQTFNKQGYVQMLAARSTSDVRMAEVGVDTDGTLKLTTTNNAASSVSVNSTKKVAAGDLSQMELLIKNANTSSAKVEVWVDVGEGERQKYVEATVNFTGKTVGRVRVGGDDNNNNALWDFYYDRIRISDMSMDDPLNFTYYPGNHIEYYGPYATPKDQSYGPYGVRIPVRGGGQYTVSVSVSSEDASENTSVMRWRARSSGHRILETYDFVAKNITGDTDWTRYSQTFTVPAGTAYIEWFENNMGAGTVWIHGIQLEKGAVATEFTDKNFLSGSLSVYFQTAPPDMDIDDPMEDAMGIVDAIRGINAVITDDDETSFTVDFRSGNTLGTLGSYTTLVENLNKDHEYIEVRVQMTSSSDTNSPELTRIEIDLDRPFGHLLHEDGTEFPGSVLVSEVNAEHPTHQVETVQYASGETGLAVWGNTVVRRIPTLKITAFRKEAVEEIVESFGAEFVRWQNPYGRYTLRFEEIPAFETNPLSRIYLSEDRNHFFQVYTTTVAAIVQEEELF